jgi:enoyl-CoA hydratase
MCTVLDASLVDWAGDDAVDLVVIDAAGPRAFCAGGDIAALYHAGITGDFARGQAFWRREYRMNLRISEYPKPIVSLMQGFTMGGGVGVGCHARHRIVGESSQISMPETAIGLIPDVGGSWLLSRGPGALGVYLAATGARMGAADAIYAGLADYFVPEADWPALIAALEAEGIAALPRFVKVPPEGVLPAMQAQIDRHFAAGGSAEIAASLRADDSVFAADTRKVLGRMSPLATACAVDLQRRLAGATLAQSLELEYRFTHRAQAMGDFLEGVRAAVIDKDRNPRWLHDEFEAVTGAEVAAMLAPLGADAWTKEEMT